MGLLGLFLVLMASGALVQYAEKSRYVEAGYACIENKNKVGGASHQVSNFYLCEKEEERLLIGLYRKR